MSALDDFHPIVRSWFTRTYGAPSPPQELGWPHISAGENTLILAPTGSGKTLAAFLWAINHLVEQKLAGPLEAGVRILYVSPLKALNNDIERNLEAPLRGIADGAREHGVRLPDISAAVRTGDTPQSKRAAMIRRPPDILITTPESLYLMLTSPRSREMFRTVQYCIVDEIHSLCSNKRGVHLSLTLERLQLVAEQQFVRIGLSATQRPLERIAAFLVGLDDGNGGPGPRPVTIVDAGRKKETDLRVMCPVPDFSLLPQEGVWPMLFDNLLELIRAHRTTLVFVNNRRLAERVASRLNEMTGAPDAPGATNLYAVPRGRMTAAGGEARGMVSARRSPADEAVGKLTAGNERLQKPQNPEGPAEVAPTLGIGGDSDGQRFPGDLLLVQAYHGSMSREAREAMEADLKAGKLRALIATSSLELGIDIGSIDLVVQLQSPKGVARGLQRIGRSGHLITATSKGRILPTHREDLVESAVIAASMLMHDVEETTIPENPLDVLAQQIVAMVSVEEWDIDRLYDVVRRSYCYRSLPRQLFSGVVQMLAGRYAGDAFSGLQARLSWDRVNNLLRPLPGSGRLAITGGGTISDRGYFGVYLADGKTRVGEVDEEFVYETRVGDTFLLGTSVWRVTGIDANRVSVDPAPGQPARMPFWRGEGIGRGVELGRKVGAFRRELAERLDDPDALSWLEREFPIDSAAAWNILDYFRRQRYVAGVVPHDRRFLVEGFRDEIGDPRIVVHTSLGRRINTLFGFVLGRRLHVRTGVEPQVFTNDDGILLRCHDLSDLPLDLFEGLTTAEAESVVTDELLSSPLFGGQFRQNAVRALIMTRPSPGRRAPLWLQRLKAGDLLQVVRQYDDFPIVIETVREALNDILDFRAFKEVVSRTTSGAIEIVTAQTEVPSPFTASLLFDFMAVYMYEWDQPKADTLSRFVSINRELLAEVVDLESVRAMIRPEAVELVERQLQHREPGYRARSPEELMELLVRLGDLTDDEVRERCEGDGDGMVRLLERDGRALLRRVGSDHRWIAGEERALYSDLAAERSTHAIVRRFLQNHGPSTAARIGRRYEIPVDVVESVAERMVADGVLVSGRLVERGDGDDRQFCFRPALERIHRQTLTILRREITPSTIDAYARFLLGWQGVSAGWLKDGFGWRSQPEDLQGHAPGSLSGQSGFRGRSAERQDPLAGGWRHASATTRQAEPELVAQHIERLQGLALPVEVWLRDILPVRCGNVTMATLDQLTAGGLVVWAGAGSGRIRPVFRGSGALFLGDEAQTSFAGLSERAVRVYEYLESHGASFFGDVRKSLTLSLHALNSALAELFWSGLVTNDVFSEILRVKRVIKESDDIPDERLEVTRPRSSLRSSPELAAARRAIRQVPGWSGRWSLLRTPSVLGDDRSAAEVAREQAARVLRRYGVVAREVQKKESMLPWSVIAGEFQRMEMRGDIRRGYFLEGFSGMQFALPEAVERIRSVRDAGDRSADRPIVVLNSCDPASPYGILDGGPSDSLIVQRAASTFLVLRNGVPVIVMENYGRRVRTLGGVEGADDESIRQGIGYLRRLLDLPDALRPVKEISVELWNGERAGASAAAEILREERFRGGPAQSLVFDGY